jgi:hypothetical protein
LGLAGWGSLRDIFVSVGLRDAEHLDETARTTSSPNDVARAVGPLLLAVVAQNVT